MKVTQPSVKIWQAICRRAFRLSPHHDEQPAGRWYSAGFGVSDRCRRRMWRPRQAGRVAVPSTTGLRTASGAAPDARYLHREIRRKDKSPATGYSLWRRPSLSPGFCIYRPDGTGSAAGCCLSDRRNVPQQAMILLLADGNWVRPYFPRLLIPRVIYIHRIWSVTTASVLNRQADNHDFAIILYFLHP